MKLYVVDVFTDELFGGNPAGVVIIPENRKFPDDLKMQKIARELRYSETAFVQKQAEKEFKTRYFTAEGEIDLCGHATIGTFYSMLQEGIIKADEVYLNHTLAGDLNIYTEEDNIWMDMAAPKIEAAIENSDEISELYNIMGVNHFGQGLIDDK